MIAVRRTLRGPVPSLPFRALAEEALGPSFELSVVMCGDALARRMNREHRGKSYSPNVLSFPLSKNEGEIFLNPRKAAREARAFGVEYREWLALLFVHGCLHLKGFSHGRIMEAHERRILRRFGLYGTALLYGHRHRDLPRQGRHSRTRR